jgi:peptidoglycan/LPS O-acetylase OafA/YrhL
VFDWLRFALASIVAFAHTGIISWGNGGNLAVKVFFGLSGWLIGGILIKTPASS